MKQINVYFEEKEYKKLVEMKNKEDLTWHDFIIKLMELKCQKE